jgi:hypothetical protein
MSAPIPPQKRKKKQKSVEEMGEEELLNEVYGPKTRALKETLAAPHKYGKPAVNEADSTFGQRLRNRIRRMTGG